MPKEIAIRAEVHKDPKGKEWLIAFIVAEDQNTFVSARHISADQLCESNLPAQYMIGDALEELSQGMKVVAIERFHQEHQYCHALVPRSATDAQLKKAYEKLLKFRVQLSEAQLRELWSAMICAFERENRERLD